MRKIKTLVFYYESQTNKTLSYQHGWHYSFFEHPMFDCKGINLNNHRFVSFISSKMATLFGKSDLIVILHSVFSNSCNLPQILIESLSKTNIPKVYFVGNEYKLIHEKIQFSKRIHLSLFISMNPNKEAHKLLENAIGCKVSCIPSSGLNQSVFYPKKDYADREIDIGYRSDEPAFYLGHNERREINDFFKDYCDSHGLKSDISLDSKDRFDQTGYSDFLNNCKGQIGTEAGGAYFELDDRTRKKVNIYVTEKPDTKFEEIYDKFFKDYKNNVTVWTISGRHVEAAACKSVQILFEGYYNGYFKPDIHYISLKKNFSNIDEVMRKFKDTEFSLQIAENAYNMVQEEFPYEKLIDKFYDLVIDFV